MYTNLMRQNLYYQQLTELLHISYNDYTNKNLYIGVRFIRTNYERKVAHMKKRYRIGICLVLIVCLLLLSACAGGQTQLPDDPAQSTGQSEESSNSQPENTGAQDTENTPQQEKEDALPETLEFQWESSFLNLRDAVKLTQIKDGKLLTYESLQEHVDSLINIYPYFEDSVYMTTLKNLHRPQEFFQDHSLVLIGLSGKSAVWEVTEVRYADGVLKCNVTESKREIDTSNSYIVVVRSECTYCFVEIDTILPEGTQIEVEINEKMISVTDFQTKLEQFKKKCLYDELSELLQ